MKVLLLKTSPTIGNSFGSISSGLLDFFKIEYSKKYPEADIILKDLNELDFLKSPLTSHNIKEFFDQNSDDLINELKNIDKLVIATGMNNFNYCAILKNYIDRIMQANKTFRYKYDKGKDMSEGLVNNLTVSFIITQGAPIGWYPFADLKTNLIGAFKFIGASIVEPVIVDGTKTNQFKDKSLSEMIEMNKPKILSLVERF